MLASHHARRRHRSRGERHRAWCGQGPSGAPLGQRQDRHRGLRPWPGQAGRRAHLDRRDRQGARRRGPRGPGDRRPHRVPRDHGRARQDPPSEAARRTARGAVGPGARRRHGRARRRADRPRVREPLPLRAHGGAPRGERRGGHREHRRRRPDDDPRVREEPRVRGGRRQARGLRRGARGAARGRRSAVDGHPRGARGRRVRLHRALRHGDRALVRRALRGLPAAVRPGLREDHRPLLRREPAPARRVLPAGRLAHAPALDGAPAPGPAALVQQPLRPRCGAQGRARVRGPRLRDHQAREPLRRGGGADRDRGLRARLRVRSGQRLRRHHRGEPPAGPRGGRGDRRVSSSRC